MNPITNYFNSIKNLFFHGLIFIMPIAITFALLKFCFNLLKGWLLPFKYLHIPFLSDIPHFEIIIGFMLILFIGFASRVLFLKPLLFTIEYVLAQAPFVSSIYSGVKQLTKAFTSQDELSFQSVVFAEFPRKGAFSIGFLTGEVASEVNPDPTKKYYHIYIPNTPNPTTGHFIMLPETEFHKVNLSRHEAMTLVLSGGIIKPAKYVK